MKRDEQTHSQTGERKSGNSFVANVIFRYETRRFFRFPLIAKRASTVNALSIALTIVIRLFLELVHID